MEQNARQLPERVRSMYGSATTLDLTYAYDANSNITSILDGVPRLGSNGHRTMGYDALDRLTHVESATFASAYGGANRMDFGYDALDNLKTWKVSSPGTTARDDLYCYNGTNRLAQVRNGATACSNGTLGTSLSYDPSGNVQVKNTQAFDFDYGNRLREVIDVERYRYDAHGRRILAMNFQLGTVTSQYAQSGQLLFQKNPRTGVSKDIDHVYFAGSLVAQREQPIGGGVVTVKYQHTDALGSPVVVTSQTRAVLERVDYEPYGKQLGSAANTGNDRPGYTGHVEDRTTGLTYMQQRYYDGSSGVFLSADPVAADRQGSTNFNRFRYADSNPYRFTDPDGRRNFDKHVGIGASWGGAPGATSVRSTNDRQESGGERPKQVNPVAKDPEYEKKKSDGEAGQAVKMVGKIAAGQAYLSAQRAREAAEKSGLPAPHNGKQDAYRHCVWSCDMVKNVGSAVAKAIGDNHETWGGGPNGETQMDLFNNAFGRRAGESDLPCAISCMRAVEGGDLILSPREVTP